VPVSIYCIFSAKSETVRGREKGRFGQIKTVYIEHESDSLLASLSATTRETYSIRNCFCQSWFWFGKLWATNITRQRKTVVKDVLTSFSINTKVDFPHFSFRVFELWLGG